MHWQARAHHKLLIGPAWLTPGACSKITVLEKPNTGRPSIKLTFVITDLTLLLLLRQVVFITLLRSWHHMAKGMQLSRKRKDRMRVSHRHQVNEAKPRCHHRRLRMDGPARSLAARLLRGSCCGAGTLSSFHIVPFSSVPTDVIKNVPFEQVQG